jgi:hypothetical protein
MKLILCHKNMEYHEAEDGGIILQILRVSVTILNKEFLHLWVWAWG